MSKKHQNQNQPTEVPLVETTPPVPEAAALFGGVSPVVMAHVRTIEDYCRIMAPGTMISEEQGASQQLRLFNAINAIVSLDNVADMTDGCDRIVSLFAEHRMGALAYAYTQRFIDRLAIILVDDNKLDLFTAYCGLFSMMCTAPQYMAVGRFQNYFAPSGDLRHLQNDVKERLHYYIQRLGDTYMSSGQ